jgi:LysM repeat protein
MIEFDNISENYRFDIKYTLRNLELILGENNMLTISAEVLADATMFEETKVDYVNDFYSTNSNLNYDKTEVAVIKNKESITKQVNVRDNIGVTDDKNRVITYNVSTGHLNTKVSGSNLYVDGPLKVSVTFENKDTKIVDSKTYDMLVDTTIPLGKEGLEDNVDVSIVVENKSVTVQNGNVEANVTLNIIAEVENIDKITIIGNIEEENLNPEEFDSMYMYIVKKGDTLWTIAKKYKTTVDKIANVNNILDENKIDIGQKLLIIR